MKAKNLFKTFTLFALLGLLGMPNQVADANNPKNVISTPTIAWNTFWGTGAGGTGIKIDGSGNIYVGGFSSSTENWEDPVNTYAGDTDAIVAKFDCNGDLKWNTFLGSENNEQGWAIAVDTNGNVYISGRGFGTWGNPVNDYTGAGDAFVAKLDSNGALVWNTFVGTYSGDETGSDIAVDEDGNVYVAGTNGVVMFNSNGELLWKTFASTVNDIELGKDEYIYITGDRQMTWGRDQFVAKLDRTGTLIWEIFLGGEDMVGTDITLDSEGNIFVSGYSIGSWGNPVDPYEEGIPGSVWGGGDGFVAKLNSNGVQQWNTFLGGASTDIVGSIQLDADGNIYASGLSFGTWGDPVNPFAGGEMDAFVALVNSDGIIQWHTFMGSVANDQAYELVLDANGNVYTTGQGEATWGNPINPFVYMGSNLFVARLEDASQPGNQSPIIEQITAPIIPVQLGQSINATVTFTDPDIGDSHVVKWDWGDGSMITLPAAPPTASASHIYSTPGVYTVTVTITDAAGTSDTETFQYIVIYDPNGGFVTGGGWINSPAGAYTPDPTLTGKATFGFVSKYQKGADVPTGNTEFQFHVAGMNFKSTSYDWLVIAGTKAQYKGTGTINGIGEYKFILTAIDGSPDKFRIKIWDAETGNIIYDNMSGSEDTAEPSTVIEGGSIVVHKTK